MQDLSPRLYNELRRIARARLRIQGRISSLNTTALVHETYLRIQQAHAPDFNDEKSFYAYAAKTMRSIIVDLARQQLSQKNEVIQVTLSTDIAELAYDDSSESILRINEALETLSVVDKPLVEIIELYYFVGLTQEKIAEVMGITSRTVRDHLKKAYLLLKGELETDER